jgi:hypothetical protein
MTTTFDLTAFAELTFRSEQTQNGETRGFVGWNALSS